ncbi:tetratricopeptide repeat protein [Pedobacter chitinilyticus]|uniref:Tetratricopeptide repeat protein n=1 Tax=Pedobacter chitinilyticus TaxID=2233776 RepID=A0A3S3PAD6_9SPHI|nr:tetratricopeptide repeat protein [Pedobacter chitinilyticus]
MLRPVFFLCLLLFLSVSCFAQESYINAFVKSWSVTGTAQTDSAEASYVILRNEFKLKSFLKLTAEFNRYLENNTDKRLRARYCMFDVLGRRVFNVKLTRQDSLKIKEAIKMASNLKDDQLLAEIYALAADIDYEGGYLLYNLKAIELQKRIGYQYFSYVQNRYLGASLSLYKTKDFRESIKYGEKCLTFKKVKVYEWDPMVYIFQLDVLGASHLALGEYKKAINYYQQIIDTIQKKPIHPEADELWMAIANGNIGRCYFYEGNVAAALPLIDQQLQSGIKYKQYNNIAIAQNARGEIFLRQKQYATALIAFKEALKAAITSRKLDDKVKATKSIAIAYTHLGQTDSAIYYQHSYGRYQQEQDEMINKGKLSAMNARMLFDNAQKKLEEANTSIQNLKQTRTAIFIAIALLSIIGWLLYNRQALKIRLEKQQRALEAEQAHNAVEKAKQSLQQFRSQMLEKDKLIENLSLSLKKNKLQNNFDEKLVNKNLLEYVLVTDEEWRRFKEDFNKVYPLFYPRLHAVLPDLTSAEERLASLIFLQMSNKEIANTLGISADSVARSKRRLKQRLPLAEDQSLETYILSLV